MKVFTDIENFFAWVVGVLIPKAQTVATDVEAILGSAATNSLLTLAGESAWAPKFESIVGSIIAALATAAADGKTFSEAVAAYGLNPVLDVQALQDLEAIFTAVKSALGGKTLTVTVAKQVRIPG